ncbi:MAG: hypothetical protein WD995_14215 [Gemmatimonadota bacterium]
MSESIRTCIPEGNTEDTSSNPSSERHCRELLERRYSRREVLAGGIQAAVAGFVATSGVAAFTRTLALPARLMAQTPEAWRDSLLGFSPVPIWDGDEVAVAPGYTARPFGHHHDGMHFFPPGGDRAHAPCADPGGTHLRPGRRVAGDGIMPTHRGRLASGVGFFHASRTLLPPIPM